MGNTDDIQRVYMDLEDSMARVVGDQGTAFSILWFDIHRWLEPDNSGWKADFCGYLTEKITGQNIGSDVHVPARDNTLYYQEVQKRYAFGKTVYELGEEWKLLIREEDRFSLGILLRCLDTYYKKIMPYVKNEMVAWWNEDGNEEIPQTLKLYRKHRAKVRATMQIVETATDIFNLQGKDQGWRR